MGNKKSSTSGAAYYLNLVTTLKLSDLNFQKVEKLLTDKCFQTNTHAIKLDDFVDIINNYFITESDRNPLIEIHKVYLQALYDHSIKSNDHSSINIYWALLLLIPILNNTLREKAKAFFICTQKIHGSALNGKDLKYYFDYYFKWNLIEAPNIIYKCLPDSHDKEGYEKFIKKVATKPNVEKVINETMNLIAAKAEDLEKKRIIIQDLFHIGNTIEYSLDLEKMINQLTTRFRLEDEN